MRFSLAFLLLNAVCFAAAPKGWNSWNSFANIVNSRIVQEQAKVMASNGMKAAGYEYVVIDEGWWLGKRDAAGNILVDPQQWPALQADQKAGDMANIAAYIHSLGLKAGIYTDAGRDGCSMYPDSGPKIFGAGSEDHYEQDFLQFSRWGFDYVKVDWCGGAKEKLSGAEQYAQIARAIGHAEKITGRHLMLSICEWGSQNPWFWGPGVGNVDTTLWRTGGDIIPPVVESLHDPEHDKRVIAGKDILNSFDAGMHPEAQHTGYYNDLDMMVMGMRGMNATLDRMHMGLWAIASAPLMVGSDLTRLPADALALLTNREALAIHDDAYGLQPIRMASPAPAVDIWVKPVEHPGKRAVMITNRSGGPAEVKLAWEKLGLKGAPASMRDVWSGRDLASSDNISVAAHDTVLLEVTGEDKTPAAYTATGRTIKGIQQTAGPTFARLHYANHSGRSILLSMTSTSGLSTTLNLASTAGVVGIVLPHGVADLSFGEGPVVIQELEVYPW